MKITLFDYMRNVLSGILNALRESFADVDWNMTRAAWRLTAIMGTLLLLVQSAVADPLDQTNQTIALARDNLFDFSTWEAETLLDKARAGLVGAHSYLDEDQRVQFVRDYMEMVNQLASLERQVTDIYSDSTISDPQAASAELRAQRDMLRAEQARQQPVAEAIIESQIATTLVEYGFGSGGSVWPPVRIRFTQPPGMLIVSPRERIERIGSHPLQHNLTVDEREALEQAIDGELDVSALTVPLGGLAVYPAMLIESGYAPNIYEIGSHEWAHHYLSFYPLGFRFGETRDIITINETVASLVGDEIGLATLQRYYPDLVPSPPAPRPDPGPALSNSQEPLPFDFRSEMRETRITVDDLLAEGRVEEAETYMEQRRVIFVEQGYSIRKLNQAYFAFYGSYADVSGATGTDPIGPAIVELRELSPTLLDFVVSMRSIITLEELESELEAIRAASQ